VKEKSDNDEAPKDSIMTKTRNVTINKEEERNWIIRERTQHRQMIEKKRFDEIY
jgi:hypothetical protein